MNLTMFNLPDISDLTKVKEDNYRKMASEFGVDFQNAKSLFENYDKNVFEIVWLKGPFVAKRTLKLQGDLKRIGKNNSGAEKREG